MASRYFFAHKMFSNAKERDEMYSRDAARKATNIDDLSESKFRRRYRLSKSAFMYLCHQLSKLTGLRSTQRVSLEVKVLIALNFYATGSKQRKLGGAKQLSQVACSVYIEEITNALTHSNILEKFIKFPVSTVSRQTIRKRFFAKYGIPGVIGCIDCTHIGISGVPPEEEWYRCRNNYNSLNVQMVCDDECRILNVNPKFGGSNHAAHIFSNSLVHSDMQSFHKSGDIVWLLGDSAYPQRPWLMTPILEANRTSAQANYNTKHTATWVLIKKTIEKLKNRWKCLNKIKGLKYRPTKCANIIMACCVLHNIGIDFDEVDSDDDLDSETSQEQQEDLEISQDYYIESDESPADLIRGRLLREQLVKRLQ